MTNRDNPPRIALSTSSFGKANPAPRSFLLDHGVDIKDNPYGRRLTKEEAIDHLSDVDGLLAGLEPLDREVLSSASSLKAVARVGIGMSNVDEGAAREFGIKVSNTPQGPTNAVAEMTLTAALAMLRGLVPANEALHNRDWPKKVGLGLHNTPVLFIGYGRIGRRTAEYFRALGAKIHVYDPYLKENALTNGETSFTSMEEGLRASRVISLHAAGEDEIIGPDQFSCLPDDAYLLNSARGGLVNEDALVSALKSGKLAGAWLDAFWEEPYKGRLCDFPQVLMTPHACTYSEQCRLSMEMQAAENLLRDLGVAS